MPVTIPDNVVETLRAVAPATLVEIACRLYDADVLEKPDAVRLAGMTRVAFEDELSSRGLPWIRLHGDNLEQDVSTLQRVVEKLVAEGPR